MEGEEIKYRVSRREVKYPRLEYKTGELVIIAPPGLEISPLIERHKEWILNKTEFINQTVKKVEQEKLIERDEKTFRDLVRKMETKAEKCLEIKPQKIYFRAMKTKWASCSKRKNITFNTLLKHLPTDLIWYVIFHEFCHLIIPHHNKKFWLLVSKEFDEPEKLEKELFGYWFLIWRNRLDVE